MHPNPRILITNDDGIDAPGIRLLHDIAQELSDDVWLVAPRGNQSGAGHRFTLGHEIAFDMRSEREIAVAGTPADCVVAGCTHFAADKPVDIVLSGVNNGQNLGDIIHCSGTAAGAREGALQGALGVALSQAVNYADGKEVDWTNVRTHAKRILRIIIDAERGPDTYYNVNFPFCDPELVEDVRLAPLQRFSRSPFRHYPSKNEGHFFVTIPETPLPISEGSDFHALHHENAITVTPLSLHQHDQAMMDRFDGAF